MKAGESQTLVAEAEGILIVDELATLIDANAFKTGMIPVLTKLYDGKDFDYHTKARGRELICNPCLSLLGGSTLHWIKESIPSVAIGGGFTSRVVFVFRESFEKLVPWPTMTEGNVTRADNIVHDLNEVAKLRGMFALNKEARKLYEGEYEHFYKTSDLFDVPSLAGYAGRRHTTLLKVAMCISASLRDTRMIDEKDIAVAINALRQAESDMPRVLQAISREFFGDVYEECLTIIMNRKTILRSDLLKAMKHKMSSRDMDVVVDTFVEQKVIKVGRAKGELAYTYVGDRK